MIAFVKESEALMEKGQLDKLKNDEGQCWSCSVFSVKGFSTLLYLMSFISSYHSAGAGFLQHVEAVCGGLEPRRHAFLHQLQERNQHHSGTAS